MNGRNFIVDTNVALYLLSGNETIADILENTNVYVSFVTQLELLGFKGITAKEVTKVKRFLADCIIVDISEDIKNKTIAIKQSYQIKLPDSIIAATSLCMEIPLLTADKGFEKIKNLDIALYKD